MLEVYFPVCHFFDGSNTNWMILSPANDYSINPPTKRYHLPFTYGINYTRQLGDDNAMRLGMNIMFLYYADLEGHSRKAGDVVWRDYYSFAAAYLHPVMVNPKFSISFTGGLDFRYGNEIYHIYYPNWFEQRVENRNLADLGPSIGLKLSKPLPWNFQIGTEAKYTRFLYRRDKGNPYYPFDKGASPNLLTVQLNVGYRF